MADMLGYSIDEMMKIRPGIRIILVTGFSRNIADKVASIAGVKAIIYKPVLKENLAKIVRNVLDGEAC